MHPNQLPTSVNAALWAKRDLETCAPQEEPQPEIDERTRLELEDDLAMYMKMKDTLPAPEPSHLLEHAGSHGFGGRHMRFYRRAVPGSRIEAGGPAPTAAVVAIGELKG